MAYQIDVDGDVFDHLNEEAARRLETPNTVLRRLLKLDAPKANLKIMGSRPMFHRVPSESMIQDLQLSSSIPLPASGIQHPASRIPLPQLPHHIPTTLEHTLQMVHLVRKHGFSRIEATKALADWHRVAIPTITIKFTRLLGISAHEMDALLEPERRKDLVELLTKNFPDYSDVIGVIV